MLSVLYVDDEESLLEIGKLFLEEKGDFHVDTAVSAIDAMEMIRTRFYDAIVSDYQMPKMDGIEFLKQVRSTFGNIPFILFTGKGREEVVIQAINNGADFYLQKGGDPTSQFAELDHNIRIAVERRRAVDALVESEQRLAGIIDFLPDATFAIDTKGVVIAWNRAIEEMTDVPAADMIGKGDHGYAIPFYNERRPILVDLIRETEDMIRSCEYTITKKERDVLIAETSAKYPRGLRKILSCKASLLYNKKGEIAGAIESIRDITETKRAEEELRAAYEQISATEEELRSQYDTVSRNEKALRESEEKYRLTLDATNDGIWEWNIPTGTAFFSPRWFTMLGYESGELPGTYTTWLSLLHPDDSGKVEQKIRDHIQQKDQSYSVEFRMRTKPGNWKWILARGRIVERDAEGNPVLMVGTHTDIDERKKVEEALRESEERFRIMIEQSPYSIQVMTPDGWTLKVNHAYEKLWGATFGDLKDYNMLKDEQLVSLGIMSYVKKAFSGEVATIPPVQYDANRTLGFGEKRWVQGRIYPVRDNAGAIRNVILVHEDITERKLAEESLQQLNRQLNLMTSITRHDLLNKIMAMHSYLVIARKKSLNPEMLNFIEKLESVTKAMKSQIEFTRVYQDLGMHEPQWQNADKIVSGMEVPSSVTLQSAVNGLEIYADSLFEKVFNNLLDNTLRHGGEVTRIILSCHQTSMGLVLVWEDNGGGVPAIDKDQIFERGFGKNNGLGLFLVREILAITGISVRETGMKGEGARFEILVPNGKYRFRDGQ